MSILFLWFLCWFIPIFSKCTSNIMIWSAKLSLHLCVTLLCVRFKWVMVQRSKHVDALLSPDAISLPHVPSSVAFFLRNSWRLKVAAWIGWTSSIYMEESTVVQLLLELWTPAFKNMTTSSLLLIICNTISSSHFSSSFLPLDTPCDPERKKLAVFEILKCSVFLHSAMIIYNERQLCTEFHWSIPIYDVKIASHCSYRL